MTRSERPLVARKREKPVTGHPPSESKGNIPTPEISSEDVGSINTTNYSSDYSVDLTEAEKQSIMDMIPQTDPFGSSEDDQDYGYYADPFSSLDDESNDFDFNPDSGSEESGDIASRMGYNVQELLDKLAGNYGNPPTLSVSETENSETPSRFFEPVPQPIKVVRRRLNLGSRPHHRCMARTLMESKPRSKLHHARIRALVREILRRCRKGCSDSENYLRSISGYFVGHIIHFQMWFPQGMKEYSRYLGNGYFQIARSPPFRLLKQLLKSLAFRRTSVPIWELKELSELRVSSPAICRLAEGRLAFRS